MIWQNHKGRILLLHGGWEGHQPAELADFARRFLFDNWKVVCSEKLGMLDPVTLGQFYLIVPAWTYGQITTEQEQALLDAVEGGLGVVAWHGAASAFLASRPHKFLIGGQFVAHPGGPDVTYDVHFLGNDPLVEQLEDFAITSEQYYMLIDPAVKVLATTRIKGGKLTWVDGVEMPIAWTRWWGRGRVFYCSLGHSAETLRHPVLVTLLRRAALWAARSGAAGFDVDDPHSRFEPLRSGSKAS
jgi:type 1 glutamine amidotransferase